VAPLEPRGLPRTQLGQLVGSILGLLLPGGDARKEIRRIASALDAGWALREAERIAGALAGGATPVIVACGKYAPLAWRWKSELAENAKMHALIEVYPEAGHNTINAWEHAANSKEYAFIIIKANTDDEICAHIEDWLESHYDKTGETVTLNLRAQAEKHPLAALLTGSMTAGITSSILAVNRGRDPTSITGIKRYKNAINNLKKQWDH
jgi:glucose-6-phosphate isomerase